MFEAVKVWPGKGEACRRLVRRPTLTASARAGVGEVRVGTKKRAFRSNKENRRRKKDAPPCRLLKLLLDKAPYKTPMIRRGEASKSELISNSRIVAWRR